MKHLLPDSDAKNKMRVALAELKKQGTVYIDAIDLHLITELPFDQISRLLEELKLEGVVKEYDSESEWPLLGKLVNGYVCVEESEIHVVWEHGQCGYQLTMKPDRTPANVLICERCSQ